MTLIDELLYALDGEAAMAGDAATVHLDAVLAKIRRCGPNERLRVLTQLTRLHDEAALDARAAEARRVAASAKVREWEDRVIGSSGDLRTQASERVEAARANAVAVAEEVAEYRATVERLAEVRALIASAGG